MTIAFVPTALAEGIAAIAARATTVAGREQEGLVLRHLQTGGDQLRRGAPEGLGFTLRNEYGPAENAVITSASLVPPGPVAPTIGRPIDGVRVYVLDRRLRRAPIGTSGELVTGGTGLARGYLGDPAETAARFVPDPFVAEAGARMYRSGDRVRLRSDGEIEFLGRVDQQVKIRGQRIELEEIEAALAALPGLRAAAVGVAAGPGGESDRRLVAYVVPRDEAAGSDGSIEDAALIEALSRRLGDAMVPRSYVRLAALPLTANGKIDRPALAAIADSAPVPATGGVAPRTEAEARLAAIWAEMLGLSRVGVEDDFFALGGHSLLAAQLAYRLEEDLGVEVPVALVFEAPTVARLARRLEEAERAVPAAAIPRVERGGPLPLSVAQERIWFLEELEGPSALHHIAALFTGSGALDVSALAAALDGLWERHEALRARFAIENGRPVQRFAPAGRLPWAEIDLQALGRSSDTEAARLEREAAQRPFDLSAEPLVRARLITLGNRSFRLALVVHHLVADGVSVGILEGELSELYAAAIERRSARLADLPCQYADFAAWQRTRPAADEAGEIDFWRAELSDLPPLELPVDSEPGPASSSLRHLGRTVELGTVGPFGNLGPALATLAKATGTTPFVALLTGLAAALARFAGQEEFGLGIPEAGRTRREAEPLVGLFVNTVVVRVNAAGDPAGRDLALRLRDRLAAALAHATTPFERVVEALAPERDRERSPWFQAMAASRPAAATRLTLSGVDLNVRAIDTETAKFDLTVMADAVAGAGWSGSVEYDATRFDAATIERWIGGLARLLADLAERPEARLSDLRLLAPSERVELLALASGPEEAPRRDDVLLLDDLVAHWERATPLALAVSAGAERVTYVELGARANALAWRLRALGVGADAVVAVCLDRSIDLVASALGVLRAGAAYAPIDPAYPQERRADMVAVAGASAVITLSSHAGDWVSGLPVVLLDRPDGESAGAVAGGSEPPPVLRDPDGLAYAIFTSGSTGRPKCVAMSHRGALHIVSWHLARFGWTGADRGSQVSGPSFDAAVIEIWPALCSGASLHVPEADVRLSAPDLLAWFAAERLTIAWAPTPLIELMMAAPAGAVPELSLRALQTGGDRLHRGAPAGALYELCNQYGPAENAVVTTQGESVASAPDRSMPGPVPSIGRPIDGVRAYVLDHRLNLAPAGTPGELAASGGGLARGYRYDPRQTAERFVPDPFSALPGTRMYHTGDRVRLRRDGTFDFLGRIDSQVKIRGQRIELGEIEAALLALPFVREAAVLVREEAAAGRLDRRLVGYVVLAPSSGERDEITDRELIEPLRARLADAMVPRRYVRLAALPLTANGKVDARELGRLAIPAPHPADGAEGAGAEPAGDLQIRIAAAYRDLIGVLRVGAEDDFFALGGHSLLAAQLIHRLRDELGAMLPVSLVFEAPTVAGLARRIAEFAPQAAEDGAERTVVPLSAADRSRPVPLSYAQERLWFIEELEGPSALHHIPAAFRIDGAFDVAAFAAALGAVEARHEALRARFAVIDGRPVQRFVAHERRALPVVDLAAVASGQSKPEADRLLGLAAARPFDLGNDPLLRTLSVRLSDQRSLLALVVHHLVADGVSLAIIEGELSELYAAALERRPARLPEASWQYADYAVWERSRTNSPGETASETQAEIDFWRTALLGLSPLLLPWDREPAGRPRHRGRSRPFARRAGIGGAIGALARRAGTTPFAAVLAGFAAALARASGQVDFGLGIPEAGRRRPEAERLVGLFVNTLVLRVDAGEDPSGVEFTARLGARLGGALAHSAIPFARLVEALAPERDLARSPWFQAMAAARPATGRGLALPGAALAPVAVETGTAKFELTLFAATDSSVADAPAGDFATIEYDSDRFDAATIDRLERWLEEVWPEWGGRPELRLSDLPALGLAEQAQVVRARYLAELAARTERAAATPAADFAKGDPYEAPRGALEERLAALFAETLERPAVSRRDDFFALGGHSLLGSRVIFALRSELGWPVPFSALFEQPTVAELAAWLATNRPADGLSSESPPETSEDRIAPVPRSAEMPLSRAQERLWFIEQLEGPSAQYNIPAAFEAEGLLDRSALGATLDRIVSRHEALRARFAVKDGQPVQSFAPAERLALPEADLAALGLDARASAEADRLLEATARLPFDLARGPLLRSLLVRQGTRRARFVLVVHHLVADGVSLAIIESELSELYAAALSGRSARLAEPVVQYADFAAWQRSGVARRAVSGDLREEVIEREIEFWRTELADLPPLLLPWDREPSGDTRHRGRTRPFARRVGTAAAVADFARHAGSTPFVAVLTGFAAALARFSGQVDFGLGVPESGRHRPETEGMVGLFVNTLVVRVNAAGDPSGVELAARLGARMARALGHATTPFARLVEALAPDRDLDHGPWFQAMVTARPATGRGLALPGVLLTPCVAETGSAKFELTLFAAAEPGMQNLSAGADEDFAAIEYDADRFDPSTIDRLERWLEEVWPAWSREPERRLSELPKFTRGERAQAARTRPRPRRPTAPAEYAAPETALEEKLTALFATVLERQPIGRHDDFFALGGHSLLGSRVIFSLRAELGWEVPFSALFERPTPAALAAWLEEPRARQSGPGGIAPEAESEKRIEAVRRSHEMPLSSAQERLWFLEQLDGPSPQYHIATAFSACGKLDDHALRAALYGIWRRHEELRARFSMLDGGPVQSFAPAEGVARLLGVVDLEALSAAKEREAARLLDEAARLPFDLATGPMLRGLLVRLEERDARLALVVHHLIADGISLAIIEHELSELYAAAVSGRPARLAGLPWQYADFVVWQRRTAAPDRIARRVAELGTELGDAIEPIDLPIDRPRPPVARHRGETREIGAWLGGAAAIEAVWNLARGHGATEYQVWLALFSALLGRLSGRLRFTVGLPVSGRIAGTEGTVGLFADTRVLAADLSGDPTGVELIERSQALLLAAEETGDVPFDRLVEALVSKRDRSTAPLYQVALVARVPGRGLALPGAELVPLPFATSTAKRDLTLFVDPSARAAVAAGAGGAVEYDLDLFDPATIERLVGRLGHLAVEVAARPTTRISDLDLLAPAERHQLLVEGNELALPGAAPDASVAMLDRLVDVWVRETPDAVAVSDETGAITYGELAARAGRLALRLKELGVAREERVAICLDRSIELVIAELGVLYAGAAYAPIDPAYPQGRRADMVALARARVAITLSPSIGAWCDGLEVIAVDALGPCAPGERDRSLVPVATIEEPDLLAYAMFTSGSTGRPKGVGVSHRCALHIVSWATYRYGFVRADRVAQVSGPSFDAAVVEIWPAFSVGATLCVPSSVTRLSPIDLYAWFVREGVTITWVPTPIAEALLAEPEPPGLALRYLQTGGDRLHHGAPSGASFVLSNHYGPVENSVFTTEGEAEEAVLAGRGGPSALPTIGRPVGGVRVYVLSRTLDPAPLGAPGELVAGGRGVARGYLGDPAQTADRFRPDPFAGEPGARMYRTGDRVRVRLDREIDFLGRFDTQVKIRGQRVELGEIEAALLALPAVREAAVLVREVPGRPADRRLVAYVALVEKGAAPADQDLIEPLAHRLADAMVPRLFVRLLSLPINANGKIDRRALAALAPPAGGDSAGGVAPRTELEAEIAAVWASLLGLDRVGVEDDFFVLGGHSLIAARLTYRLHEALGVELPVAALFETPTVAGLARKVEELRRQAGPGRLLVRAAPRRADPALDSSRPVPLSFAQERLWFIEQLEGASALYHIPAAFEIEGPLAVGALYAALDGIWSRHEALRARIFDTDLGPVQTFEAAGRSPRFEVDLAALSALAADEVGRESARIRLAEWWRPFDLAAGSLLRALLVRRGAKRFEFALVLHHLVADGASLAIIAGELGSLYAQAVGHAVPALGPPSRHGAVASWQRDHWGASPLEPRLAERLAEQVAELRSDDGAAIEPLDLPTDRPRPVVSRHRGALLSLAPWVEAGAVRAALAAAIGRLSATAFQVWFAAFGAFLCRLTGRESIAHGLPVEGRNAETEHLVGLLADTRVARAGRPGDPSAAELIAASRSRLLALERRGEVPFERLVEALVPTRSRSTAPLFQAAVSSRTSAGRSLVLPGLALRPIDSAKSMAKWDLTLSVAPEAVAAMSGGMEYDEDLFDQATIARWLGQIGRLLVDMGVRPEARLSELHLLSAAERTELLAAASVPALLRRFPPETLLHEPVAHWEATRPDALALSDASGVPEGRLTYAQLGARANRLAWRLRELGVGVDDRVAICLPSSADLITAELGVLRAGAAYAPIDPAYPVERRGDMVAVSGARVVVTRSDLAGAWCGSTLVLALDRDPTLANRPAELPPTERQDPESLAYVIFTSGSTGKPKGVAMSHRGALHFTAWHLDRFGWTPEDRGSQVSGPSFDAAVGEIWPALLSGASLHLPPSGTLLEPEKVLAWLVRESLTIAWGPTPIIELMLAEPQPKGLALRALQAGGDRLQRGAPADAPYVLANIYGPAENACVTTIGESATKDGKPGEVPPIGRPLPGVSAYMLDRRQGLAPRGAAGELGLGGNGLARGYLGDPGQTAERFVPDPFSGAVGARLYRTGDRVRLLPSGDLDFLGRFDTQVKIRGQRIELGEIEAALFALPNVREAAVLVREGGEAGGVSRRLVAYVVLAGGAGLGAERELIEPLKRRLSDAMVPRDFVLLDRLPTTANGKVDRRALAALPAGPGAGAATGAAKEIPRGEVERQLAAIWEDLLGISGFGGERIGRDDDFFALGGHSLLATRAAQRIRRTFEIDLPLAVLFDEPTLAGLARWIFEARSAGRASVRPGGAAWAGTGSIPRADRGRPIPLSFAQERLWLLDRFEPQSSTYTIPAAIVLSGPLAVAALRAALTALVARHESLRTTFALGPDGPEQRIAASAVSAVSATSALSETPALPLADLSGLGAPLRQVERERLYGRHAGAPFNLTSGPLARFLLVATGEAGREEHALLLALHHAVSDGWSVGVLVHDLAAFYGQFAAGKPAGLPALAIQVADHATWQRGEQAGPILARRLAHWRQQLSGAPAALLLPLDRLRPAVRSFRGDSAELMLTPDLADGVRRLARGRGATLFMTLLAAWAHQLGRLAGQDDVVIGTPAAERDRPELAPLIGMFLNTLVLRLSQGGTTGGEHGAEPSLGDLVERARKVVLDAFTHEVPFESLLDELRPERDLSRTPLFQVFLNMVNLPKVEAAVEGLSIASLAAPEASAKFDITVYASEVGREIKLLWVYNADLFEPARIAAMLDQFRELLAQGVAEPDSPAAALSLVSRVAAAVLPDPRRPLSDAWMGSVGERFATWAERSPERLAVADPDESLSYGELLSRVRRLAHRLRRDGVGRGDVVAILGHRSARLVWAVLGVLEAGAAFTVLDPAHPPTRLVDTLRLARPRAWVALEAAGAPHPALEAALDEIGLSCRLVLGKPGSELPDPTAAEPDRPLGVVVGPDDLAYLSFTSGSTGVPKGILGRHGPLSHFVPWQERRFGFGPEDRYSMLSGLAHDPLQRDLFTPLQTGAAVIAPLPADLVVPGRLAAWLRDAAITVAHLTPAMGQILCELAPGQPVPSASELRWAFFVGDVLTRRDVDRLVALAPNVTVINYYGSTETQRSVGYHAATEPQLGVALPAPLGGKQSLPLGRGIEDVDLLVVNRAGRLAGVGELGEILVRGPHLAAGYLGDPGQTASRFVANPLAPAAASAAAAASSDRAYRTGDLGRYRVDGEVEFGGRADVQIKIRGFRIEPGEIEALLGRHPAVRECVVVAREGSLGDKRLIAYVVLGGSATPADLRAFLKSRLPEYMVPSVFAILEKLPVNPNGKVDRSALPEPTEEVRSGAFAAPQTEIERTLAAILREVLGVEKVGKDDNFFELGGNSLQMVKVHARIQETFGADLQVVQLFTNPTVSALAAFLSQGEQAPRPPAVVEDRSEKLTTGRDRLKRRLAQRKAGEEQG